MALYTRGPCPTPSGKSFDAIAEAYARQFSDELERKPYDRALLAD